MRADILNELSTLGKKVDASMTHLLFLDNAKHHFPPRGVGYPGGYVKYCRMIFLRAPSYIAFLP